MRWIERVERKLERLAIPRIGLWLVAGQVLFYLALAAGRIESADIVLIPNRVLAGEAHRLLTFLFDPPRMHPVFLFFALYLFLLMARGLETQWGAFRFNLFLLTGYVATLGAAFLFPSQPVTNLFLGGSVFLAFAYLHPDFELSLFFLLPVKIKWLAAVTWAGYGLSFLAGPASASIVPLLVPPRAIENAPEITAWLAITGAMVAKATSQGRTPSGASAKKEFSALSGSASTIAP
jgi:hypothetical protein